MKHLLFVSVALGIFSGTSTTANAQNSGRLTDAIAVKKSEKFIDGIEIKPGATTAAEQVIVKSVTETVYPAPKITGKKEGSAIESANSLQFKYAQIMDIEVEAISNHALYDFIEKWWATDYRYGGTTAQGIDCSAYTGTLLREVYGIDISRTSKDQYEASEKIRRDDLQEGDLVFFNTRGRRGRTVSHVGVYLRNGYFTHSSVGSGVTISSLDESYYNKRFISGGRIAAHNIAE